ncbi:DUF748 domain-containing protein [Marinobacter zhejiangensis]|uniref:Uncharacterized protein involved in outer membrane biogenesis n=1 Tax=Marinobacter zhejiangensis TaxID=488535 RepID=A0A1I4LZY8_9GAMM|nr:DUF748 domain-containing protein [Marinobacter zhejiangensis]SFL96561.1 Uncharacterized protein involved in outer membrane biogenesis [Marinobacter zhejiangensis]
MAKQGEGKAVYKRAWFWGAVVVLLYALAGFVGLPWWLERTLPKQTSQYMGWQTSVENVSVNPFAMTLEVTGLAAQDANDEPVVAFDRFYVDLGFWRLLTGVLAFDTIELVEPNIRLDLLEDYNINFARDWQTHNPAVATEAPVDEAAVEPSAPPKLYLGRFSIAGGELLFRDFSSAQPESFSISPLDLELNDLATYSREGGNTSYTLDGALGGETTFSWEGSLNVVPLHSKGHLRIGNVDSETIAHFVRGVLPYNLADGAFSVESDYELAGGERFSMVTSNGTLGIKSLAVAVSGDSGEPELSIGDISVDGVSSSLVEQFASVGTVSVDGLQLSAVKAADGQLNWLAPLAGSGEGEAQEPAETAGTDGGFRWSVDEIKLSNSQVQWRDEQLDTPANLALQGIELTIGKLSQQLEEPVPYELAAALAGGGNLHARGQATLVPFTLETGLSASAVALAQFEPYVQSATNLAIRDGSLTVDGNLDLDGQKDPMTGTFSGNGELKTLDLGLVGDEEPLLGWQTLQLAPIEYNLAPARLEIGTVTLATPRINVTRSADGQENVTQIAKASDQPESQAGGDAADAGMIFRIGELVLQDGGLSYTDRSISPTFVTRMHELNGTVAGLSNIAPQQGSVAIQGRVGELGRVDFSGSLGAIGGEDTTRLKLDLTQLSLPTLSPYSGRYLGYNLDSGKLKLDLTYEIAGSHLKADNLVILDQLELGEEVDSEDAVNAPIELGLALLRDRDGIIEVDLPVEGNLDDPEFRVGRIVTRAFVNLLVKAAASPFSMLGSVAELAGLSGEELGTVYFDPGSPALDGDEAQKLDVLAQALKDRSNLLLNVRGAVSQELDGLALKQQRLARRIGLADDLSTEQRLERLEQAYRRDNGNEALEVLRGEQGGDPQTWEIALLKALTADITLPPEALGNLAVARGQWLQRQLLDQYEIPSGQLFLRDPQLNASNNDDRQVAVEFTLDVR